MRRSSACGAVPAGLDVAARLVPLPAPPLTGIGVAAPAGPRLLLEVEATAVLE
ncbi:hypothetical protein SNE510_29720 [Streptomyces sp. NE5-10]|nr:hypothetical protein SNE510_29720 [Streptomyces sp. NE5-10]